MNEASSGSLSFYVSSGRAPARGIALGVLAGLAGGTLLAWAYSYLLVYLPIAGYVTFLIAAGFGGLVGALTGFVLRFGRVRNAAIGALVGLVVALMVEYVAWAVWVHATLARADVESSTLGFLVSPPLLWNVVHEINRVGAWSLRGATPTGTVLWVLWSIELLLITGAATAVAGGLLTDPFCERCEAWATSSRGLLTTADSSIDEVRRHLEQHSLAELGSLGPATADAPRYLRYDVHSCASCDTLHALDVVQVARKVENGKVEESEETPLRGVLVTSTDVAALRALASRVEQGAALEPEPRSTEGA
ncbi:MAG: hypothetical protein U0230_09145 [Polyangiales bacterium]